MSLPDILSTLMGMMPVTGYKPDDQRQQPQGRQFQGQQLPRQQPQGQQPQGLCEESL